MKLALNKRYLLRTAPLLIALLASALLAGCTGKPGDIYGDYYYDGYMAANFGLGGFPNGTIYTDTYYQIQPGTYTVTYTLEDGYGYYYPAYYVSSYCYNNAGDSACAAYYYSTTYTCSENPGKLFGVNGADKQFDLYLSYSGLQTYGSMQAKSVAPHVGAAPRLGTYTISRNGLLITVTNKIEHLAPGQSIGGENIVGKPKR